MTQHDDNMVENYLMKASYVCFSLYQSSSSKRCLFSCSSVRLTLPCACFVKEMLKSSWRLLYPYIMISLCMLCHSAVWLYIFFIAEINIFSANNIPCLKYWYQYCKISWKISVLTNYSYNNQWCLKVHIEFRKYHTNQCFMHLFAHGI